jgi:hypothetical protein
MLAKSIAIIFSTFLPFFQRSAITSSDFHILLTKIFGCLMDISNGCPLSSPWDLEKWGAVLAPPVIVLEKAS